MLDHNTQIPYCTTELTAVRRTVQQMLEQMVRVQMSLPERRRVIHALRLQYPAYRFWSECCAGVPSVCIYTKTLQHLATCRAAGTVSDTGW